MDKKQNKLVKLKIFKNGTGLWNSGIVKKT
jgi:hypothetical protein